MPCGSYRPGWQPLTFRISFLSTASGTGYGYGYGYWQEPETTLKALEYGGASATGALAYAVLGRGSGAS